MLRLALVALVSSLVPLAAQATCPKVEPVPDVLTGHDQKLPADGGVLVGFMTIGYDPSGPHAKGDPSDAPWVARDGKGKVALARTSLAPGLSVYVPAAGTGAFTIEDAAGKPVATFTRDPKAAKNTMTAPDPIDVTVSTLSTAYQGTRQAKARLKSAPPATAIAVIVYSDATPISFMKLPATHEETAVEVFEDPRCGKVLDGARPPNAGEKVTFAWVDAYGRLSPKSAPVAAK